MIKSNIITICKNCNELIYKGEDVYVIDDEVYCSVCVEEAEIKTNSRLMCVLCGKSFIEDCYLIDHYYYCEDCVDKAKKDTIDYDDTPDYMENEWSKDAYY